MPGLGSKKTPFTRVGVMKRPVTRVEVMKKPVTIVGFMTAFTRVGFKKTAFTRWGLMKKPFTREGVMRTPVTREGVMKTHAMRVGILNTPVVEAAAADILCAREAAEVTVSNVAVVAAAPGQDDEHNLAGAGQDMDHHRQAGVQVKQISQSRHDSSEVKVNWL